MIKAIWKYSLLFLTILISFNHVQTLMAGEKVWIFLQDKGRTSNFINVKGSALGLSERSLKRRQHVLPQSELIDKKDLPLNPHYLTQLKAMGLQIHVESRWLNAVSAILSPAQLEDIRSLHFVQGVRAVAYSNRNFPVVKSPVFSQGHSTQTDHNYDYGTSRTQNKMIRVPDVHDLGITGSGVLIGMIDTGFDFRDRAVFDHLDVVAEHDFIWDDDTTTNSAIDPSRQDDHGTETLSVIAGYLPGSLIGPAFQAQFALAKTEWLAWEFRFEEDLWVAGLEWLEAQGVDVVSSSVAYSDFDDGFTYTYDDLNGASCVTTIAAEIAFEKGMIVVNSAGNERNNDWHYIMSPADGKHVFAVGAVDLTGEITYFSSVGPTADGRIKPDVMAMGMGVVAVNPNRDSEYDFFYLSGTSFSCPIVAGVCALVLDAHPELTPLEVQDAVRMTSDRSTNPDTLYGWGIVNAYEAIFYHGMIFKDFKLLSELLSDCYTFEINVLSKQGVDPNSVVLHYGESSAVPFENIRMDLVHDSSRFAANLPLSINQDSLRFYIEATDWEGNPSTGPWDAPLRVYTLSDTSNEDIPIPMDQPSAIHLFPNYPNPFNQETHIVFDLNITTHVQLKIYNINGQVVRTLLSKQLSPGFKRVVWDGRDEQGVSVASGLYLSHLKTDKQSRIVKMSLLR
ncbi:S8 family serine peptidase [candidate division KSB1 bacterium]|nr:S8 family serine peptidase [candidate division KSB1 bacterium]